ncbi:uncharacterized protein BDW70DRAFT_109329 [Aspergillus foveolatus]|uniref:uncharacterized protein n=1 Tax=Aspergillus foveolatus TaxID=210207 RepID=UPI003CCCEFD8
MGLVRVTVLPCLLLQYCETERGQMRCFLPLPLPNLGLTFTRTNVKTAVNVRYGQQFDKLRFWRGCELLHNLTTSTKHWQQETKTCIPSCSQRVFCITSLQRLKGPDGRYVRIVEESSLTHTSWRWPRGAGKTVRPRAGVTMTNPEL